MVDLETKKRMKAMVDDYEVIYSLLGFIPGDDARVRACNGLFIEWNRKPIPSKPAERISAVRKGPVVEEPKPIGNSVVTMSFDGDYPPVVEVTPKPPEKPTDAGLGDTKPPVPVAEPSPPVKSAPSPVSGVPGTPPIPAAPLKAQSFDVEPGHESESLPAYDRINLFWNWCPNHPGEQIDYKSQRTGKDYQACLKCQVFLGADGKRIPMRRQGP